MNTQDKTAPPTARQVAVVAVVLAIIVVALIILGRYQNRVWEKRWDEAYFEQFEQAEAELRELADGGCHAPFQNCRKCRRAFDNCLEPSSAKQRVIYAMDHGHIAFGTRGVTQEKLDELEAQAEALIASQKLAHLKTWGIQSPWDLDLLEDICRQVYTEKRTLPGGNPTEAELKQLLPPGVAVKKLSYCWWGKD